MWSDVPGLMPLQGAAEEVHRTDLHSANFHKYSYSYSASLWSNCGVPDIAFDQFPKAIGGCFVRDLYQDKSLSAAFHLRLSSSLS